MARDQASHLRLKPLVHEYEERTPLGGEGAGFASAIETFDSTLDIPVQNQVAREQASHLRLKLRGVRYRRQGPTKPRIVGAGLAPALRAMSSSPGWLSHLAKASQACFPFENETYLRHPDLHDIRLLQSRRRILHHVLRGNNIVAIRRPGQRPYGAR